MNRQLPFTLGRIFNVPLLITPQKLEAFMLALPGLFTRQERDGEHAPAAPRPTYRIRDHVAILPIHGVLVRRHGQIDTNSSPLESYERIGRNYASALNDRRVRGILLDIDSPGGESGQVMDLARQIREGANLKPVWAVANDDAFSAAYALASAAERIWTTRTGGVGSIGTVALHADQSHFDEREGFHYSYVYAGARKIDGHPHAPLTPEARTRVQSEVDRLQRMFVETVARHRGVSAEAVAATEAGIFFGQEAIDAGFADRIGTPDQALAALAARVAPATRSVIMSDTQEAEAAANTPPAASTIQQPAQATAVQQPPPPAPPASASEGADNVVALATAARQQGTERAAEIVELCVLAHRSDLATNLIRSEMTVEQVRRHLTNLDADAAAEATIMPIAFDAKQQNGPPVPKPISSRESFENAATNRR